MKFIFNDNTDSITLPKEPLLNKIEQASLTELKVLLYASLVSSNNESFDENDITAISSIDSTDAVIALQFWRGAGVLLSNDNASSKKATVFKQKQALIKETTPIYSGEEIARIFDKNSEIQLLVDECQSIAGKVFNPTEINKLVALYDYLGLSCEYIMLLYNYCKSKSKTNVAYVEKTAYNLFNEGVDSDEKLQEYIKYKEQFDSVAGNIRRIFGTSSRALTKKEEQTIKTWTEDWAMPIDMIEYAYELTVNATNKASMPYASKILENWHNNGITSVEKAKEQDFEYKNPKKTDTVSPNSSFDDDEFFEAALKRSYENLGKTPDKQ